MISAVPAAVAKDRGVSLPRTWARDGREVVAFGRGQAATGPQGGRHSAGLPTAQRGNATCVGSDENMCLKPNSLGVYCDGSYATA
jgi:alcohol dehydrogenase/propanol-preferring alcohol dehydrogenase